MNLFSYLFCIGISFLLLESFNWASMKFYEWNLSENVPSALKISMMIKYAVLCKHITALCKRSKGTSKSPGKLWCWSPFGVNYYSLLPSHLRRFLSLTWNDKSFAGFCTLSQHLLMVLISWNIRCLFYEFFTVPHAWYWKRMK